MASVRWDGGGPFLQKKQIFTQTDERMNEWRRTSFQGVRRSGEAYGGEEVTLELETQEL